jgi:acid phosphatase
VRRGCSSDKLLVRLAPVLLLAAVGLRCGSGGGSSSLIDPSSQAKQIPIVSHVFLLVEENHAYGDVIGNGAMPYTNHLAQQYSLATQYYANVHNSLPDYFILTVGNPITNNDLYTGTVTVDNVVRALTAAGKSWRAYAESVPGSGYMGPSAIPYARDHNPFTYFSDVQSSAAQAAAIVPFSQLAADLQNNSLADYSMIIPNLANDGHDCPNEASYCSDINKVAAIDSWIESNIGPLLASAEFENSVLIYTWDESVITDTANGGGHVATILISPKVKQGYQSTTFYQHQSTLRLTMQLLGVTDYPGAAATAPDMAEFF